MYFLCKSKQDYKYFWWKLENYTYSVGNMGTHVFTTYASRGKNMLFITYSQIFSELHFLSVAVTETLVTPQT